MELTDPFKVYTAASNLEAHTIVVMLKANGIEALVETDDSGASVFGYGIIHQFHQPNVWIESASVDEARNLIREFEETKRARNFPAQSGMTVRVECEACGKSASFPQSLEGTAQECPHCGEFLDVGDVDWDEDPGGLEEEPA